MRLRAVLPPLLAAMIAGCTTAPAPAPVPAPAPRAQPLTSPGCTTATAPAPRLPGVRTAMTSVSAYPYGVVVTPDGGWAFVSGYTARYSAIMVLRLAHGGSLTPAVTAAIVVGSPLSPATGEALTPDGRYLLAASGNGAVVLSVASAASGGAHPVLGTLADPRGESSAVEVAVSPDGEFAFVSMENSAAVAVFDLRRALTKGFGPADFVGTIPVGLGPVGLAVSPGGRWLYVTSELEKNARPGPSGDGTGPLAVVSLRRAETDPASSVVATVKAGCNPVRVVTADDGSAVWVTARGSDDVLCFSASRLVTDPARALVAVVRVGEAPVGLVPVRDGTQIVVADSNRFAARGADGELTVVNASAALAGAPAVTGNIPAGQFPREMTVEPGGAVLLVTNFGSDQVQAVSVPSLP